jgi:hypothetical protein
MKYVNGQTLHKIRLNLLQQNDKITIDDVIKFLFPIAEALDYAHKNKVIHRDIKPDNILIDEFGVPFIIDFDLAAQIHTSMTRISQAVMSKSGTLIYKAPEQWQGELQDAKTDQYAFGVVVYEFLSGRVPFIADNETLLGFQVLQNPVPKIAELPENVNEVLAKVLAKERKNRYENCIEFIKELNTSAKITSKPHHKKNLTMISIIFFGICLLLSPLMQSTSITDVTPAEPEIKEIQNETRATPVTDVTPASLFDAVEKGEFQKVKYSINAGVNVNTRDKFGFTPLHYAAKYNAHVDILKYLVSQGAEVNAKSDNGFTPLDYAIAFNHQENITYLKSLNNSQTNNRSTNKATPKDLFNAVKKAIFKK